MFSFKTRLSYNIGHNHGTGNILVILFTDKLIDFRLIMPDVYALCIQQRIFFVILTKTETISGVQLTECQLSRHRLHQAKRSAILCFIACILHSNSLSYIVFGTEKVENDEKLLELDVEEDLTSWIWRILHQQTHSSASWSVQSPVLVCFNFLRVVSPQIIRVN